MTTALHSPPRRRANRLQEVSLLEGPMLLLRSIRGFSSHRSLMWIACVPIALFGLGLFNLSAHAADMPELNAAFLANNLWLLVATILVIFMNAGFAMVEAGMCRQKNAVNILAKNLFVFALAVTAYWVIGYSFMYGDSIWDGLLYFGKGGAFGLFFDSSVTAEMISNGDLVPTVDFLFQAAFAGTAATIVSGLVAERVKFGEFVGGKAQAMPGHNMSIATLGALILWIGWYGFNPGSQLAMDQWVPYVAVTTTLAAAGGAIGATVISTWTSGKPDLTMIINGILAGLVSVTAGCGNLTMAGAWLAGLVGGVIVVFSVSLLDSLGIDDPVGAFSVHGVCGVWGTLVIGLWGYDIQGSGAGIGLLTGGGFSQLWVQFVGCLAYGVWTVVTCWIAWTIIGGFFGGIRVSESEEIQGLDIGEHGMEAYPDFASTN